MSLEIALLREALDDKLLEEYYAPVSDVSVETLWQDENQSSLLEPREEILVSASYERKK